ncbi:MAG: HAD-IA family hydrolase [Pseudoxanthomonas sp.]
MSFPVRAITLDLDDTLWPFPPIGARIERALDDWMREHSPATAAMFPLPAMRELRERVFADNPHLLHDLGALRRMTLEIALRESGGALHRLDEAYEIFYAERNKVDFYPDTLDALERLARRVPLASLSNGNADLRRIGLADRFAACLHSREHGAAKPEASFFHAACAALDLQPHEVLHVGDHVELDALGAARAGLRSCWLNRPNDAGEVARWPDGAPRPDLEFSTLAELADWLEAS